MTNRQSISLSILYVGHDSFPHVTMQDEILATNACHSGSYSSKSCIGACRRAPQNSSQSLSPESFDPATRLRLLLSATAHRVFKFVPGQKRDGTQPSSMANAISDLRHTALDSHIESEIRVFVCFF